MNAVRWQCNLHPSRSARALQALMLGCCCLLIVGLPWPEMWHWGKVLLLLLLLMEGWRNQRLLQQRRGRLILDKQGNWLWDNRCWHNARAPGWLPIGVLLVLRNQQGQCRRLWLMYDNMPPGYWRALRASCFMHASIEP
ncbi:protein YgfX [Erwiniaceae bacterium L1_54_6]|nr:protein YgfX [Erwiniaceae bacterium L1_54_6]